MNIQELAKRGFVTIEYPKKIADAVRGSLAVWKEVCALPSEVKKTLPAVNARIVGAMATRTEEAGYRLKMGEGVKGDRKERFDITLDSTDWLMKNIGGNTPDAVVRLLAQMRGLVPLIEPLALSFARSVEAAFNAAGFEREVKMSTGSFFIRFLHYFGDRAVGEEIATPHVDQSGFTLHLYESAAGLQGLSFDGTWRPMPVGKGSTVIIPDMQLQLRTGGALKALCHRVIATPETVKAGRYSAVCFVRLQGTPEYDGERCGRLQEKEPGFNYGMKQRDFERLFKK